MNRKCFCNDDKNSYFSLCFDMLTVSPTLSFDPHSRSVKKAVYISPFYIKAETSICAGDHMRAQDCRRSRVGNHGSFDRASVVVKGWTPELTTWSECWLCFLQGWAHLWAAQALVLQWFHHGVSVRNTNSVNGLGRCLTNRKHSTVLRIYYFKPRVLPALC